MISVVIPAFNEEKFLPRCLDSLLNQDYKGDFEIMVVNNGSTDDTDKVASRYGVRVISCPEKGVIYARQMGASSVSGQIIVQADADTIYPQDWLSRIARHFVSHPESVALAGVYTYNKPPYWAKCEYFLRNVANVLSIFFLGNAACISGANFAFRRQAYLKAGGYGLDSLYPDQWGISHRLSKVGKVSYDRTLSVMTSVRSVESPFFFVLIGFILNTARTITYFVRFIANILVSALITKITLIRTLARKKLLAKSNQGK